MSLALIALLTVVVSVPSATAAPRDVGELPASLQKYVPGSEAWRASPWMTARSCRDRGGDVSAWAENVIADTPALLTVFNSNLFGDRVRAEDRPRNEAILSGYRALASDMQGKVPTGYCVDDVKRWTGENPDMKPFGFEWGVENRSIFSCVDTDRNVASSAYRNRWVGAERAPCDGFHLRCDGVIDAQRMRCEKWNEFSSRYVAKVEAFRARAINAHPAVGTARVVEKTSTWMVVLVIATPIALVGLAVLLRGEACARRRRQQGLHAAGGGIDGDEET